MRKKLLVAALLAFGAIAYAQEGKTDVKHPLPEKHASLEQHQPSKEHQALEQNVEVIAPQQKAVIFTKENSKEKIILDSSDNFETAIITIGAQKHELKRVVSGSGMKLESQDKKVSIHFGKGEGVLSENGKEFMVKEKISK